MADTIFALSSGNLPSGVAVIRLSGDKSRFVIETICGQVPEPRLATLVNIQRPDGSLVDQGLVLWFPGPASFTGEDCAELQVHGGRAVVSAIYDLLSGLEGLRLAEAGEFSRRAFENGKFDLSEMEGLSDLIASQTEMQRKAAVDQAGGKLRARYTDWRERLIRSRALIEAELDFADEEDVPGSVSDRVWSDAKALAKEITHFLDTSARGELVRDGFTIALMGPPNAGKSSLLNALAKRDVAIVTPEAGTTRDLVEVQLDLDGYLVCLIDTAGIRETDGIVEKEGIRRAIEAGSSADLVLWLVPVDHMGDVVADVPDAMIIRTKDDDKRWDGDEPAISVNREGGLDPVFSIIKDRLDLAIGVYEPGLITRARHREGLESAAAHLNEVDRTKPDIVLAAEHMRNASGALGRLAGSVDVEDLLDVIFSEFCIGK